MKNIKAAMIATAFIGGPIVFFVTTILYPGITLVLLLAVLWVAVYIDYKQP